MNRFFKAMILAVAATVVLAGVTLAADEWTKDTLAEVKKNVEEEKAILVDVREESEWDEGHIDGSVLLPLSALKKGVKAKELADALPEGKIVYTFCVVGKRAISAAKIIEEFGYEVRPLKPGYEQLLRTGFKKAMDKQ